MENINEIEEKALQAFNKQASSFDLMFERNTIVQYKRERVRNHLLKYLKPNSNILELNSGTGNDALFFGGRGHSVHATDISYCMQRVLRDKVEKAGLSEKISSEICSFSQLDKLQEKKNYDVLFSNFGGLNCTNKLNNVLASFDLLLKPGGIVCLVIISKFCLWEFLLLFKGKLKIAARRFFSSKGRKSYIEGNEFLCWYYSPSYVMNNLTGYELISLEGLCSIVPPSYFENIGKRNRLLEFLKLSENKLKDRWPWKYLGDYFIITCKKLDPKE